MTTKSKKRKPNIRNKKKTKKLNLMNATFLWFFLGLIIGMLLYSIFLDKSKKIGLSKKASFYQKKFANTISKKQKKYDFYKLLSKGESDNHLKTKSSSNNAGKKYKNNHLKLRKQSSTKYVVQTDFFKKLIDAEELKAKLTLNGFSPKLKKLRINKENFYTINLGPFKSKSTALNKQALLNKTNIKSNLIAINN